MELITLNRENLDKEHVCCAISNNTDCQVAAKKAWLMDRLDDGLVFLKGDVRGKCFIEYIPAEKAWAPVAAPGYMYIDCLWVSGQFKGHGYSTVLLDRCVADSREKGKLGLCVLSSKKKQPFLADPGFLAHKGFSVADSAAPFYDLYALAFDPSAPPPRFTERVKTPFVNEPGFVLYYSHQCPYTAKYVPLIAALAARRGTPMQTVLLETAEQAQAAPAPFTAYSLFYDGAFVTHEILSEKKFEALIDKLCPRL